MESIQCIFCHIDNDNVVIEENGFQGRKCSQCGLIYISPRPSLEEIVDLYGHDEAFISADAHINKAFAKRLYARHHLRKIMRYAKQGLLLEIGAGGGYFLDEARKQGFTPHAIEFNPLQASYIREQHKIPCEQAPFSTDTFGHKSFDIIYHCDVVSHFFDPIKVFQTTYRKLTPGGYLIFETGNLSDAHYKYYKYFLSFQYPDHLFFFSIPNIEALLQQSGFELVKILRYSIVPQLLVIRGLEKFMHFFKSPKAKQNSNEAVDNKSKPSWFKGRIKSAMLYMNYFLRYKIGALALKRNRPQTILVIARKI